MLKEEFDFNSGLKIYLIDQEERNHFLEILKGYDEKKVGKFIEWIEIFLTKACWILQMPKRSDQVLRLKDLIKHFEKSVKYLKKIYYIEFRIIIQRKVDSLYKAVELNFEDPESKIFFESRRNAIAAIESLQKLIENLKSALELEKAKKGRPNADNINLVFQIATKFKKYIDQPHPYSGPFPQIVNYFFDIMEYKFEDRSRAIRQALKKLSQSPQA